MVRGFALTALLLAELAAAGLTTKKICPVLGPSFPKPRNLNSSTVFKNAVAAIDKDIDTAIQTGHSKYGDYPFNYTAFSLSMFDINDPGLIWERHHTTHLISNSSHGVREITADSEFRIGSISKVLTMYTFLITEGDRRLNDPITDYIPQLAAQPPNQISKNGALPQWHEITIGDLACHTGGIMDDYGLDDAEFVGPNYKGVPPLTPSEEPTCGHGNGKHFFTCTKDEELAGISKQPALYAVAGTPSYSNTGFDLIGMVLENITGVPFEKSFNDTFVKSLDLHHTFFTTPADPKDWSDGVIPVSPHNSGWDVQFGPSNSDGSNILSTNDMVTIFKSIMNSTLLPSSVTRRWFKPRTFTSDPMSSVGYPWEIFRFQTPNRLYDFYTKQGDTGVYSSFIGLVPDLGFGFTSLTAGAHDMTSVSLNLVDLIADIITPTVEEVAREQATQTYGGRYSSPEINSSLVITSDEQPGLLVTEWISNGTNFLIQMGGRNFDYRLFPNELYTGNQVGFAGYAQDLPRPNVRKPFAQSCGEWFELGGDEYGNVNLNSFVFELNEGLDKAVSVSPKALRIILQKED